MATSCHKCHCELPRPISNDNIIDRQALSKDVPFICNEAFIIKHNHGDYIYYTLYNEKEGERLVCHTCLYDPTGWVQIPRERERKWVVQLTDSDMQSLQQYKPSLDHKAIPVLDQEEKMQRDMENSDWKHTGGEEIMEYEAEMMEFILEKQRNIQEKIKEDELSLMEFEESNANGRCPPHMYEERVKRNEEMPLYQMAVPQGLLMLHERGEFSDSFDSLDDDSEDFDSESDSGDTSDNITGVKIFHQVMKMENLEMSRESLTMAQTFFFYHYICSQKGDIDEMEIEVMTDAMSSISSSLVDDIEFLKFTKVLASLCMLSDVFDVDPSQQLASFLRGLLYCCNEHGYLSGACVLQCIHALLKLLA